MRTHRVPALILALGALAVAGCGSDNNSDNSSSGSNSGGSSSSSKKTTPSTSGASAVTLAATEFKFNPSAPKVKKGKVQFTIKNDGQTTHALEVEGPGEESKTGSVQPGQSKTITVNLNKDGKYEFYCPIDGHKQQGMKGVVTVGGGGGSSSSSSSSSASDNSGGGGSGY
ncbi:MAG TPA: cupredoxin domain-containing protein [Thermoleophilaceae bacterium]|jgi:uncharacterized cupredoxin-like copper-binding protein